jgi:hypothetical protein
MMGIPDIPMCAEPYVVLRSPSGAVVVCRHHRVTDDIKVDEAFALARALNEEHRKRTAL